MAVSPTTGPNLVKHLIIMLANTPIAFCLMLLLCNSGVDLKCKQSGSELIDLKEAHNINVDRD